MLLSVEPFDDASEGTLLSLWHVGGAHKVVRPPCLPHYWSGVEQGDGTLVKRRLLSRPSAVVELYRVEFPTLQTIDRYRLPDAMESHRRFVDVVACEYGFEQASGVPSVLAWDIETLTFSPVGVDWRRDTIRSISVWGCRGGMGRTALAQFDAVLQTGHDGDFGVCWNVDGGHDESSVIQAFLKFVSWFNPDVLSGFNDGDYDVRVLLSRCDALRIPCRIGRDGGRPYVLERVFERQGKQREVHVVRLGGRVHLDVYNEVLMDQTLFDLKGRGLNEVAKHFGFDPIEDVNHAKIPEDRVAEVNLDDARCTYGLAQLYLANLYGLCEYLKVPLNLVVERSPSHISNWFYGQEFAKLGIVSDGYNRDRFPQIFNRGGKPYQGATVKCYRTGLFRNVEHIDFVSFYPSIMLKYNLSPETVSLVETKPWTGQYNFEEHDEYTIIEVPDIPKLKGEPNMEKACQFVCRVEKVDSVTRKKLGWIRDERAMLKAEYKRTKDEGLQSRQYALKVIQNTLYGYHGTGYALYGNVLVAILTTALARYHIEEKIKELEEQGYKIIECDTDGLFAIRDS
jgi:DNA polymerase elongation subunit (family B)